MKKEWTNPQINTLGINKTKDYTGITDDTLLSSEPKCGHCGNHGHHEHECPHKPSKS